MKRVILNAASWIANILFWLWALIPNVLDWVGRSTLPDDWRQLIDERLPNWASWLFSTPWWVPSTLACLLTAWLIWQSYKEFALTPQISQNSNSNAFSDAPEQTTLTIQFYEGNQIPKKIQSKNIWRWYVSGNFTYHPLEQEAKYLGMWRVTVTIIFDKPMPFGNVDIDCKNCELPPYHITQYSSRHAIISFSNILPKALLTIDINKAPDGLYDSSN